MFSVKGIKLQYFALAMAVIAIVGGVYLAFFHSAGFVKTQGVISSIVEEEKVFENDDTKYTVFVDYEVNGAPYTSALDSYSPSDHVGKTVDIFYDPANPAVVHGGGGFGVYLIAVGAVIIVAVAIIEIRTRRAARELETLKASRGTEGYAPSTQGEERELYFLTETGTPKYGHRIEDGNRRVAVRSENDPLFPGRALWL